MPVQQPQYQSFTTLQQQGQARPPKPAPQPVPGQAPGAGVTPGAQPYRDPPVAYTEGRRPDTSQMIRNPNPQQPNLPRQNGQPDLAGGWQQIYDHIRDANFQGGPQSNYQPGGYRGPGQAGAPQVQAQGHFEAPQGGQQVDQRTQDAVMQALGQPSRYDSGVANDTFNVLNRQLTQRGNADYQRINEDMASRGIYASTTAGGRLGDLATNLNNQRADFATNIATDQARNYQSDRASAIAQAMGYGGQQFQQGLGTFGANQSAGAQRYGQEAQTYGARQQEGLNQFNSGLDLAQFGLGQNNQNYNQAYTTFGANQGANAQAYGQRTGALGGLQNFGQAQFGNQLQTSQFNADQDYRNNQLILQSLGYL